MLHFSKIALNAKQSILLVVFSLKLCSPPKLYFLNKPRKFSLKKVCLRFKQTKTTMKMISGSFTLREDSQERLLPSVPSICKKHWATQCWIRYFFRTTLTRSSTGHFIIFQNQNLIEQRHLFLNSLRRNSLISAIWFQIHKVEFY